MGEKEYERAEWHVSGMTTMTAKKVSVDLAKDR